MKPATRDIRNFPPIKAFPLRIECLDPIYCRVIDKEYYQTIWDILNFKSFRWVNGRFSKEKVYQERSFFNKRSGQFLAGFLRKVGEELTAQHIEFSIEGGDHVNMREPYIEGITLRRDQHELLRGVANLQRGYLKSPTGSGKTILAVAIRSMMEKHGNLLFLCHTKDLLSQSTEEFRKFGYNVVEIGAGKKDMNFRQGDVVVATVQTLANVDNLIEHSTWFDAVIIDECHHITDRESRYSFILERSLAPVRIGLTATDNLEPIKKMTLEGYLGPMIGEFSLEQGIEEGVLAEPMIEWISVPIDDSLLDLKRYQDIYKKAIIDNRARNRLILTEALYEMDKERSILILIKEIRHMDNLVDMAKVLGIPVMPVWSKTERQARQEIKKALQEKDIQCVIASAVWKEGINIPSLDVIINAAGGRSELATLQGIGRGMRTTDSKSSVTIKDFVDPYKYLSHHTILRLRLYAEHGWKMKGVKR